MADRASTPNVRPNTTLTLQTLRDFNNNLRPFFEHASAIFSNYELFISHSIIDL